MVLVSALALAEAEVKCMYKQSPIKLEDGEQGLGAVWDCIVSTGGDPGTYSTRVGRYSGLSTVITAIWRPYCNYDNYETILF